MLCLSCTGGTAQDYWVVRSFSGNDGSRPTAVIAQPGGMLFGLTQAGGAFGQGTLFQVAPGGNDYRVLRGFTPEDGVSPNGLALSGPTLYGTAGWGGSSNEGALFRINVDASGYGLLKQFSGTEGVSPQARLVVSGATLYGTTYLGGISNRGTVFKLNTDGSGYTVLKSFTGGGSDGAFPTAGLELSGDTLYGATSGDGSVSYGNVFRLSTDGSGFAVLKSFARTDNGGPVAALCRSASTLFGTLPRGGISNGGAIFRLNTDGSGYAVIHEFVDRTNGWTPEGGLVLSGINLYGTTSGGGISNAGVVFQISTNGSGFSVLKQFSGGAEGGYPVGGLSLSGTVLYGVTSSAGEFGQGVLFGLALPIVGPLIVAPPANQTVAAGADVSFAVRASGLAPLTYQWTFNGTNPIAGATDRTLQLTNVLVANSGAYSVTVANALGNATGAAATLEVVPPGPVTLTNYTETALRAALAAGGPVTFAADGTIRLGSSLTISRDSTLDATGHRVILDGGCNTRLFHVNTNVTLALVNLILTQGGATNGAGIYNEGGTLELSGTTFQSNLVFNPGILGDGHGGALLNQGGTVQATHCTFAGNASRSGSSSAFGGAISGLGGKVELVRCVFTGNSVEAGSENMARGCGGAIYSTGALSVSECLLSQNYVLAGSGMPGGLVWPGIVPGAPGGVALGGAICNLGGMALGSSLLVSNTATGGIGGRGGAEYAPYPDFGWPAGPGGPGGDGNGGAIFNAGTASAVNCTVAWNYGIGGEGGPGGPSGRSGGGGQGGSGGNGVGGIMDTNGLLRLTNCTIASCSGIGGVIGVFQGYWGSPGTNGIGLGGIQGNGTRLVNTLLASNIPGNNGRGTLADDGHNLSSDSTCSFTGTGSQNNADPKLAPLANNGGPTPTMALLPGSPAIDRGDTAAAPNTDQRGFPRPIGPAADIGAFEDGSPAVLRAVLTSPDALDIYVRSVPGRTCWLLSGTTLADWLPVATNQLDPAGVLVFRENHPTEPRRYYRLFLPPP